MVSDSDNVSVNSDRSQTGNTTCKPHERGRDAAMNLLESWPTPDLYCFESRKIHRVHIHESLAFSLCPIFDTP